MKLKHHADSIKAPFFGSRRWFETQRKSPSVLVKFLSGLGETKTIGDETLTLVLAFMLMFGFVYSSSKSGERHAISLLVGASFFHVLGIIIPIDTYFS